VSTAISTNPKSKSAPVQFFMLESRPKNPNRQSIMPLKPIPRQSPPVVYSVPSRPRVQTIEKTSKSLKAFQAVSAMLLLSGTVLLFIPIGGEKPGVFVAVSFAAFLLGLIGYVCARVLTWWHHG